MDDHIISGLEMGRARACYKCNYEPNKSYEMI